MERHLEKGLSAEFLAEGAKRIEEQAIIIKELKEVLQFYADGKFYEIENGNDMFNIIDHGEKAQEALRKCLNLERINNEGKNSA